VSIDRAGIASDAFAITPHDTNTQRAASLYTGTGGAIAVKTEDGTTVTFASTAAGTILPIKVMQVLATGTAATSILGLR
jgi:hypothetical protein